MVKCEEVPEVDSTVVTTEVVINSFLISVFFLTRLLTA